MISDERFEEIGIDAELFAGAQRSADVRDEVRREQEATSKFVEDEEAFIDDLLKLVDRTLEILREAGNPGMKSVATSKKMFGRPSLVEGWWIFLQSARDGVLQPSGTLRVRGSSKDAYEHSLDKRAWVESEARYAHLDSDSRPEYAGGDIEKMTTFDARQIVKRWPATRTKVIESLGGVLDEAGVSSRE